MNAEFITEIPIYYEDKNHEIYTRALTQCPHIDRIIYNGKVLNEYMNVKDLDLFCENSNDHDVSKSSVDMHVTFVEHHLIDVIDTQGKKLGTVSVTRQTTIPNLIYTVENHCLKKDKSIWGSWSLLHNNSIKYFSPNLHKCIKFYFNEVFEKLDSINTLIAVFNSEITSDKKYNFSNAAYVILDVNHFETIRRLYIYSKVQVDKNISCKDFPLYVFDAINNNCYYIYDNKGVHIGSMDKLVLGI